jgi:hypothetical protein
VRGWSSLSGSPGSARFRRLVAIHPNLPHAWSRRNHPACKGFTLRRGEHIEIRGFGTFQVRSYKGYTGRNPSTGEIVEVAPKRLPFFKASKNLVASINGGRK